jgi:hypothetical protein
VQAGVVEPAEVLDDGDFGPRTASRRCGRGRARQSEPGITAGSPAPAHVARRPRETTARVLAQKVQAAGETPRTFPLKPTSDRTGTHLHHSARLPGAWRRRPGDTRGDMNVTAACMAPRSFPNAPLSGARDTRTRVRVSRIAESADMQALLMPEEGLEPPTRGYDSAALWLCACTCGGWGT